MNKATINGKVYQVPGKLNELSAWQLCQVALLVSGQYEKNDFIVKALLVLLQVKRRFRLLFSFIARGIDSDNLSDLARLTDFLFEPNHLTKQILPVIRRRFTKYYGPADQLGNLVFIEFIEAEKAFLEYQKTGYESHLNTLVSVLYRKSKTGKITALNADGDLREKFNQHLVEARAAKVASWPLGQRLAIMLFFASCREMIIKQYPAVFPEPEENEVKASGSGPNYGWLGVLKTLAGHLSQYESTAFTPLGLVLFDLNASILESLRQKRELENSK